MNIIQSIDTFFKKCNKALDDGNCTQAYSFLQQAYQFLQDVHRVEDYLDQLTKGQGTRKSTNSIGIGTANGH